MKIRKNTKSMSFLFEFIVVLFLFSLASAICVQIYSNAALMNIESNDKKNAIIIASNYMEEEKNENKITYNKEAVKDSKNVYYTLTIKEVDNKTYVSVSVKGKELVALAYYMR